MTRAQGGSWRARIGLIRRVVIRLTPRAESRRLRNHPGQDRHASSVARRLGQPGYPPWRHEYEADLPAECAATGQEARISQADEDARRPRGVAGSTAKGAGTAVRLIGGLRQRASFEALRGGISVRHGPLGLRYAAADHAADHDRVAIAFAIRRSAAKAVRRNRCRRRIKGWLADTTAPLPPGFYLMSVRPPAIAMEYEELAQCLEQLFEKLDHRLAKQR